MNRQLTGQVGILSCMTVIFLLLSSCTPVPAESPSSVLSTSTSAVTSTPAIIPCTVFHAPVTPDPALGAEFGGSGHTSGPVDAPVTIIAFSDYQCLQCAFLAASLKQVRLIHPDDVYLVYLLTPQPGLDKDNLAVQAVESADLQGKFWEMHDLLFEKQAQWINLSPADFEAWAADQAAGLGMDPARFTSDFEGSVVADRLHQAERFTALTSTFTPPMLFVNSASPYTGLADFAGLDMVIRLNVLAYHQFSACPVQSVDPLKQYLATLHTHRGDVVIQLYPDKAPLAVANFIFLANHGWYDGNTFYRVLPGQMVMTGDPSGTGYGNPGYLFGTEIPAGLSFDQPGVVAMDNNGPDTNGSRFFVSLAAAPQMDGQYTIIGQVLNGLDVLSSLSARDPQPGFYLPPGDELVSVTVEER
jgi:cyclophilin family peptidyl-prolyl cis-trans isomerase/protein-disulfide isomerase